MHHKEIKSLTTCGFRLCYKIRIFFRIFRDFGEYFQDLTVLCHKTKPETRKHSLTSDPKH